MRPLQSFWEAMRNAPPGPREKRQRGSSEDVRIVRRAEEMNEAIRVLLEEQGRRQLTGRGYIGLLPRPVGLLDEEVRERRRA